MVGRSTSTRSSPDTAHPAAARRLVHDRRGFMLLAAIMLLSLGTVTLMVVTVSHTRYRLNRSVSVAVETLTGLEAAMKRFQADTKEWPGSLMHLTQAIVPGDKNACGQGYNANAVRDWRGPYFAQTIPATGLRLGGLGRVEATLSRNPPSLAGGRDAVINLRVIHIREHEAARMDSIFDEVEPRTNGTWKSSGQIRWGAVSPQTGYVDVDYVIPVSGC